jgi:hypothetical protein
MYKVIISLLLLFGCFSTRNRFDPSCVEKEALFTVLYSPPTMKKLSRIPGIQVAIKTIPTEIFLCKLFVHSTSQP